CGTVRRKPKLAPEAVNMTLFGPGVMDMTNEYVANAKGSIMTGSPVQPDVKLQNRRSTGQARAPVFAQTLCRSCSCTLPSPIDYRGGGNWLLSFSAAPRNTGRHLSSSSRRDTREAWVLTFMAATTVPTTFRTG